MARASPIGFKDFLADPAQRAEAWRRKFAMDDLYAGAQPGRGHKTIARWAERRLVGAVITQNIDGLHQAAGLAQDKLIELHGNGTYAACLSCGTHYALAPIRAAFEHDETLPLCTVAAS